jgi:hypothetical protein
MRFVIAAGFALFIAVAPSAQAAADLSIAAPMVGTWTYATASDGSEATFAGPTGAVQLSLHCTRATRRVTIAKAATGPATSMDIWTSGSARSVPVSYNPATARLTADFGAYDNLLDGMSNSRGRIGLTVGTQPPLVVPAWPEIARVVEDCRA